MPATANYGWVYPVVGANLDDWGDILNASGVAIDAEMFKKANINNPVFTGNISAPVFIGTPSAILRPTTDGATAIQFQNAAGTILSSFDTSNGHFTAPAYRGSPVALRPTVDSASAIQFQGVSGTAVATVDTVASRFTISRARTSWYEGNPTVQLLPVSDSAAGITLSNAAGTAQVTVDTSTGVVTVGGPSTSNSQLQVKGTGGLTLADNGGLGTITLFPATNPSALPINVVRPTGQSGVIFQTGVTSAPYVYADLREGTGAKIWRAGMLGTVDYSLSSENGNSVLLSHLTGNARFLQTVQGGISTFAIINRTTAVAGAGVRLQFGAHEGFNVTQSLCPYIESINDGVGADLRFGVHTGSVTAEAFRVTSAKRVAIGSAPAAFHVQVSGPGAVEAHLNKFTPSLNVENSLAIVDTTVSANVGGALVLGYSTLTFAAIRAAYGSGTGYGAGNLDFYVRTDANVEAMPLVMRLLTTGQLMLPLMLGSNPGAGAKLLWYDPADGNRVKYAA